MKLKKWTSLLMSVCLLAGANCITSFASDSVTSETLHSVLPGVFLLSRKKKAPDIFKMKTASACYGSIFCCFCCGDFQIQKPADC